MSTIITKNSATSGSTPSSLVQGELAINVTDGRLFYGSGSGNTVKEFGTTASYALSALSASYAQTASYAPAYLPLTGGTIDGNVIVNGTASIAFLNVSYESASVIYSSGSNQFGDASNDVQTLWGTVDIKSGPVLVTGSVIANSFTGSLLGTASYATNALSASYAPSSPAFPFTGSALITGSLGVTGSFSLRAYTGSSDAIVNITSTTGTQLAKIGGDGAVTLGTYTNPNTKLTLNGAENFISYFGGGSSTSRVIYAEYGASTLNGASAGEFFTRIGNGSTNGNIHYGLKVGADSGNSNITARGLYSLVNSSGTNVAGYFDAVNGVNNYAIVAQRGFSGFGQTAPAAMVDIKAAGALSTDLAFRVRNSADNANLGAIYGNGTVNLGNSNFDFQSTETSGRTAVIGASNTGASYNTYSILSLLGHNNSIASYGHTSYVGINSSINQNSGGTVTGMGESNTLVGGTIGIGMNNNIANGSANSNMNTGIGYNNAIQYEKTNTFLLGNNLRVSAAGAASMTKIGWANSAGTLAQIDRSFEVYLNGQSGSDFHVTGKTNVVLKNNSVLVSGTNYEAAATNTLTIHNGVAPITNIAGAFQLYSTASTAGNAKPYFRTENGTVVWLGDESRLHNVTSSIILNGTSSAPSLNTTAKVVQTNSGSFTLYSLPTASYDTAFFEYSIRSGSNARAGIIMAIQSGSAVNFTETTTTDFGSTSAVSFTVIVTGSNMALTGSSTSGAWTIKTIVRSI